MELVKGGDGISKAGVGAGERLGGDVDGTRLAAGTVAGEGSTCSDGGARGRRIWRKLGGLRKWIVLCWIVYILFLTLHFLKNSSCPLPLILL